MDRPNVVFAITGDVRRNSRALRQIRALVGLGFRIHVLSVGAAGPGSLEIPNTSLHALSPPAGSGPRHFGQVHMLTRAAAVQVPAAIYHASDLYVLPALRMAAERHHGRLVYDARELYPYVAATIGRPWVRVFWRTIERWGIKQADLVLTVSEGIAEKLTDAYDIARPTVLYNVPDDSAPSLRRSLRVATGLPSGEAVILHQGQMRPDRGCELLVDAMRDVEGAILVFLGDGPLKTRLQEQAAASQIAGLVRFADPVPPDELLAYTASADVGVTLLEDTCLNHQLALPNKLFEYLAAGVPVIASDLPEIRGVVRFYDVGLLVHPGHRADLVAALTQAVLDKTLRERWRRNIPRALETFSWAKASEQFLQAYRNLLAQPP